MDFLVTVLIFVAITYFNSNKNNPAAKARRQAQREKESLAAGDAGFDSGLEGDSSFLPQPGLKKASGEPLGEALGPLHPLEVVAGPKAKTKDKAKVQGTKGRGLAGASSAGGSQMRTRAKVEQIPMGHRMEQRMQSSLDDHSRQLKVSQRQETYSGEGPRHEETLLHQYGLDQCTLAQRLVLSPEKSRRQHLAEGMLWSQILGEPRCRQPHYKVGK